jgi:hypothetical protein
VKGHDVTVSRSLCRDFYTKINIHMDKGGTSSTDSGAAAGASGAAKPTPQTPSAVVVKEATKEEGQYVELSGSDSPMLWFYGDSCSFTKKVAPEVKCAEDSLGSAFHRFEVYNNEPNKNLYRQLAQNRCQGVPFFLNVMTGDFVCGYAPCPRLIQVAGADGTTSAAPSQ